MSIAEINNRRFELLVRSVVDYAIYMLDQKGHVISWNGGAERIKGYSESEIIGRHYACFFTPEDQQGGLPHRALASALANGRHEDEGWRVRKDGSRFWASVVLDAIHDEHGRHVGFAKVTRDMTAQRNTQVALALTREQLAQAQKMEAIGKLTGGVAHDFNNLLMIINGYADILARRLTDPADLVAIDTIRHAAERGRTLTRQLLAFSRREPLNPVVVDLPRQFDALRELVHGSLRGDLELTIEVQPDVYPVRVDVGEFELAIVNLAMNARDAMGQGGLLSITAENVQLPNADVSHLHGAFVAIAVSDTGTGIAPEHLDKIFDPFFTTKDANKGTGLGLSQVYGFASRSGGTVTVRSVPWEGTTFTIYLPKSQEIPAKGKHDAPAEESILPGGRVLLVEDDPIVGNVTASMLRELDYQVIRADNAADALDHLRAGVAIDLVLSDVVMPGGMNGVELAEIIRRNYPLVPALLMTGWSDNAFQEAENWLVLRKPFDITTLRQAIVRAVAEAPREDNT